MKESTKHALLLHNPTAGDEEHGKNKLMRLVRDAGYEGSYQPVGKRGWKKGFSAADLLVVAGGDGSVRKVTKAVLKKGDGMPPIAVLPMGTANNISKAVNDSDDENAIAESWKAGSMKPFDVGRVTGLSKKHFFIEALGFGVFPMLVNAMKMIGEALVDEPEQRLDTALILLAGIIRSYKAKHADIEIDGKDYSGEYLLVEVMNIGSFGPNLALTPASKPGDGQFHVVLIRDSERQQLIDYIRSKVQGQEGGESFPTIRGSNIRIKTTEKEIHIDDELVKNNQSTLDITLEKGRLRFLAR